MWLLLALLAGLGGVPDGAPAAQVCIAPAGESAEIPQAGRCRPAAATFRAAPGEEGRPFGWISSSGRELVFGNVPPGEDAVAVDDLRTHRIAIAIEPVGDEFPVTIRVLADRGSRPQAWAWKLEDSSALRELRVPREVTEIRVSAPRHRVLSVPVKAGEDGRQLAGRIRLQRLDTLSGRVVESGTDLPVIGAVVETGEGRWLAQSDASGTFEVDIDAGLAAAWPSSVTVRAAGRGRKILPLPATPRGRRWDRLELGAGGALRVTVSGPADELPAEVAIEIRRHLGDAPDDWKTVGQAVSVPNGEPVLFSDLDEGTYVIVCSGESASEQLVTDAEIRAAETTDLGVAIRPVKLRVGIEHRGASVPHAEVVIAFRNVWRAALSLSEGSVETNVWQRGTFAAFVTIPDRSVYVSRKTIEGDADADWRIEIPDRAIHGTVRERASGKPVPNAVVVLERDGSNRIERADQAGEYRFDFLEPGVCTIRVPITEEFVAASAAVRLSDGDRLRRVDFDLERATVMQVRFKTATGEPVARARVHDSAQPNVDVRTDDAGQLLLRLGRGERRRLFVVPWTGAFAVADIAGPQGAEPAQPIEIGVPDGPATLLITAADEKGEPVSGIRFRARYNGYDLPDDVLQWVAARDGNLAATDAAGRTLLTRVPVGVYELWPLTAARGLAPETSKHAPVRFAAQPGENAVRLTFTRW